MTGIGFALGAFLRTPTDAVRAIEETGATAIVHAETKPVTQQASVTGTFRTGTTVEFEVPSGETPSVVTQMLVGPGDSLGSGTLMAVVSGQPVFVITTLFPLYRDVAYGDSGDDVTEINNMLGSLGYSSGTGNTFTEATQAGLTQFYADRGHTVPRGDQTRIEELEALLDSAEAGGTVSTSTDTGAEEAGEGTDDGTSADAEQDEAADTSEPVDTHAIETELANARKEEGARFVLSHFVTYSGDTPVVQKAARRGETGGDEGLVLVTARTGSAYVEARVGVADAEAFAPGADVTVSAADGSVSDLTFTVDSVSAFTEDTGDGEESLLPGYDIRVEPADDADLTLADQATVRAESTSMSEDEILAIPLVAVREDESGLYVLVESTAGETPTRCAITEGEMLDGWMGIESDCIFEGTGMVVGP